MIDRVEVRGGHYHDSVQLMRTSGAVSGLPGVDQALVAMGTELNLTLLADLGFSPESSGDAGPNDLIVAVRAADLRGEYFEQSIDLRVAIVGIIIGALRMKQGKEEIIGVGEIGIPGVAIHRLRAFAQ